MILYSFFFSFLPLKYIRINMQTHLSPYYIDCLVSRDKYKIQKKYCGWCKTNIIKNNELRLAPKLLLYIEVSAKDEEGCFIIEERLAKRIKQRKNVTDKKIFARLSLIQWMEKYHIELRTKDLRSLYYYCKMSHLSIYYSKQWKGNKTIFFKAFFLWFLKNIMHTSILRPSTTVPWSLSRALSASALLCIVTKPKP